MKLGGSTVKSPITFLLVPALIFCKIAVNL